MGSTFPASGGYKRQELTATEKPEGIEEDVRNLYKKSVLAQKKPVVATTGLVDRGGLEPPTPGFSVKEPTSIKPLENKGFAESLNSDGRSLGSSCDEPLAQIASDELLAGLVENADDALLSRLEPSLRFVVQYWSNLSEGDQRAILAIVRRAGSVDVEDKPELPCRIEPAGRE